MKLSCQQLRNFKPKVSLEDIELDIIHLTSYEKNKIDCHRLIKSRFCPFYKDNIARSLEFPYQGWEITKGIEVLPLEEAEEYTKYLPSDFPNDQLWGKPIVIHHIGRVGFYSVTVYSDRNTRLRLEAADQTPKPEIFYKYNIGTTEVEADSQWLVARIAYEQRVAKRELKNLQRLAEEIADGEYEKIAREASEHEDITKDVSEEQADTRNLSGITYEELFGTSANEEDIPDSDDDSQYCHVISVKRYKTDPNSD